jgi:hypothetical protein
VDNPTGDYEVFTIKPDGTGLRQLTFWLGLVRDSPQGLPDRQVNLLEADLEASGGARIATLRTSGGSPKRSSRSQNRTNP